MKGNYRQAVGLIFGSILIIVIIYGVSVIAGILISGPGESDIKACNSTIKGLLVICPMLGFLVIMIILLISMSFVLIYLLITWIIKKFCRREEEIALLEAHGSL